MDLNNICFDVVCEEEHDEKTTKYFDLGDRYYNKPPKYSYTKKYDKKGQLIKHKKTSLIEENKRQNGNTHDYYSNTLKADYVFEYENYYICIIKFSYMISCFAYHICKNLMLAECLHTQRKNDIRCILVLHRIACFYCKFHNDEKELGICLMHNRVLR